MSESTGLSGYLTKQGGGTRAVVGRASWKRRWFVLNEAEGSLAVRSARGFGGSSVS